MKYFTLALTCGLMLSACGGTDTTPVPPAAGIAGLWQGTRIIDANNTTNSIPVPAGEIYVVIENATENPIDFSSYFINDTANCLDADQATLTHIGRNRYMDDSGDIATMTVNGNSLSIILPPSDDITLRVDLEKNAGLSKIDLATCDVQNDPAALPQNGESSTSTLQRFTSKSSQFR